MGLFGLDTKVAYYIMQKVKGHYVAIAKGKVDVTKESFSFKGRLYHVDANKVQEDGSGHKFLRYDMGYFEPLSEVTNEPAEFKLEPQGSVDSYLAADRGVLKAVVGGIKSAGTAGLVTMLLIAAIMGAAGYFAGSDFPIQGIVNRQPSGPILITSTIGNHTTVYTSQQNVGGFTTVTALTLVTVPQYLAGPTVTTTLSTVTSTVMSPTLTQPTIQYTTTTTTSMISSGTVGQNVAFYFEGYSMNPFNVNRGNNTNVAFTLTPVVSGNLLSVYLDNGTWIETKPTGIIVTFSSSNPVSAGQMSVNIAASGSASLGSFALRIIGNEGLSSQNQFTVTVNVNA